MAKKQTTTSTVPSAEFTVTAAAPEDIEFNGVSVHLPTISPKGIAYLLTYGFRQSLQDSVSGVAKRAKELHAAGGGATEEDQKVYNTFCADMGFTPREANVMTEEEFVKKLLSTYMAERRDAILTGDVSVGGGRGPRLMGMEKLMRDVADEWLKAAYVRANAKVPAGKDWTANRDKFLERYRDVAPKGFPSTIRAEAERRHGMLAGGAESDVLEDLLAE